MAETTLLDAVLKANSARASGDSTARAALPPGVMPFVITCMDPRLVGVLLPALGLEGMDVPQAKFAGAVVHPGDVSGTRSVLAAALFNMAGEVLVVGHTDCRMGKVSSLDLQGGLARLGVRADAFGGQDPGTWMGLFSGETQAVRTSVDALRTDPRIPPAMPVHGLLYNTHSRRVEVVVRGYEAARGSAAGAAMAAPGGMRPGPVEWASPPPPIFGTPGLAPPPGPPASGPVHFGSPSPISSGPVSFAAPAPPLMGPSPRPSTPGPGPRREPDEVRGAPPPPTFPAPPPLPVAQQAPPAGIELGDEDPGKKRPRGDSPFDRAHEMLERMRREKDR